MRIAFVSTYYAPVIGGVEKVVQELAERYVQDGHEVHVFCSDFDKHERIAKKYEVLHGVHVHRSRYWLKLSINTCIFPGVIWDLLWQKYDVVHSHVAGHDYVLYAGIISFLKGRKHIHTTHCPWTDKFRSAFLQLALFFTNNFFNYISFFFCTKVIAITPWEVPTLKRWMPEKKIVVLHNGMDARYFIQLKKNTFKKDFGIIEKNVVLLFGRLHPTKAPHIFVEVAKEILKKRKDTAFVIIGPDEGEKENVKKMIAGQKGLYLFDAFTDMDTKLAMYQSATIYTLPSYREGLPLTLFEAMASGLPIIATPCNGVPYEMQDGENGFLVPFGDVSLFAARVEEILDTPSFASAMGKKNKEKVKSYTWDVIAEETFALYK
ncbi:glycosyltransferase family 4 protein [Candidatus Woesearchaeota archaeon]|nr:glycosyltransferase family 4 protein [Candidatus Woesearchaeota archaeon]